MKTKPSQARMLAAACALALLAASGLAHGQGVESRPAETTRAVTGGPEAAATRHVNEAVGVVQRMLQEPRMQQLLQQAKGILIVPVYGRAALGVGASGGVGLLLIRRADGGWSAPVFYNLGGISAGAQVGAEAGPIALVLNNEKAVNKFMQKNAFSLNAAAGLTIVNWTKIAQGSLGDGDVALWAGSRGLYGSLAAVGVSDIRYNQTLTGAYYHQAVSPADVMAGRHSHPGAEALKQALASATAAVPAAR